MAQSLAQTNENTLHATARCNVFQTQDGRFIAEHLGEIVMFFWRGERNAATGVHPESRTYYAKDLFTAERRIAALRPEFA